VLITTDDQTATDLAHMPFTRRLLGARGTTMKGISPHPLCCPARAEFLTGQYAQNNRVRGNIGIYGGYDRLRTDQTIATYLHTKGYETIFMGKFLNGYNRADQAAQMPGWTSWNPTLQGVYQYRNFIVANDGVAIQHTNTYQTDYFTQLAEQKIAEAAPSDRPFFLWQSYMAPHTASRDEQETANWNPPPAADRHTSEPFTGLPASMDDPSYAEEDVSDKPAHISNRVWTETEEQHIIELNSARIGALQAVDEGVRDMVAALRASGELKNTLIIFTSDNGYMLGEHRFHGKILPYEPSLAVPLVIRGPGIPAGVETSSIGTSIDLAPTIVAAAEATAVRPMDGRNLLPVLKHGESSWETLLIQAGPRGTAEMKYGWFYRGVRDERWTYVYYLPTGEEELYDRRNDPSQLDNLALDPAYADVMTEMRSQLQLLQTCAADSCRADFVSPAGPFDRTPKSRYGHARSH
jgi:arylsulfatase A-like enzyme